MPTSNLRATSVSRSAKTALSALLVAPALAPSASAAAYDVSSDAPTTLDAIVVSDTKGKLLDSPKFTEPLRDIPQTISVVPKIVIDQQSAVTLSDVLRNTPGITFAAGEGGTVASGDSFYLRGFDTSGNIFIDGVRDTGSYSRDVFDVEQVEIAKGPAGADNGRGGAAGYINLATKSPHLEAMRTATAFYASGEQRRATLDVTQPVTETPVKGAAVRVAAEWQDSGVPGRDYVQNKSVGVAPSLALGLGQPTHLVLVGTYFRQKNLPDSGLPVIAVPGGALLPAGVPTLPARVAQSNFYGLADADFDNVTAKSLLARAEHEFGADLRINNQTKIADNDRNAINTYVQNSNATLTTVAATTTPLNPATGAVPLGSTSFNPATNQVQPRRIRTQQYNQILSNQTNVTSRFHLGVMADALSAGVEITRETQDNPTWSGVPGPAADLYNPDVHRAIAVAQIPYQAVNKPFANGRTDTLAGYLFDTLYLLPKLSLNGSVRDDNYSTRYNSLAASTIAAPTPTAVQINTSGNLVSWKGGLVYKPVTEGSLYVAGGNAYTPPGTTFALSTTATNQNNPNLDAQETRNFEAGVKWDFFRERLATSLAVYRSENLNGVSTDAVTGIITQDISQTVKGVEGSVTGKINEHWLVLAGVGYIDSRYESAGTTSAANDGAQLRFTPRWSGNLWTSYQWGRRLTLGGGTQYSESVLRSTANTAALTNPSLNSVPSYWLINLMAEYALNRTVSLRLNINNAANEKYFRLNNNGGRYYPGATRTFIGTVIVKF